MNANDIRQKYLNFFKEKSHAIVSSSSLLPENDPTTLFTGSGMQPMVPFLLGESHPQGSRIADSQKCFRSQDIEEVGDNRHTTFFEMLGNWSLGDYFKEEQIAWMFAFLTKELGLDPNKIYITAFAGQDDINIERDEEGARMWQQQFEAVGVEAKIIDDAEQNGMQGGRIFYYEAKKNWWSRSGVPENMPVGEPGGPDTEMFWDFGEDLGIHEKSQWKDEVCHVNCDCGRFFEIGNNVFMQYLKTESGFEPLPQKNVDFGGGLERLATAVLDTPDVFQISLFDNARNVIESVSGKTYGADEKETFAFRVILDHLRAATFLIADGAPPSNKDQGYFTRRLMRRAIRFAGQLGIEQNFCGDVAKGIIDTYKEAYPALAEAQERIVAEMNKEEDKFRRTISQGMKKFDELVSGLESGAQVSAKDAFDLYQSYGFPIEMTEELADERGFTVDMDGFRAELKKHQELSRQGSAQKFKGGLADTSEMSVKYHTATHLLHAAVQKVLGKDAVQKGSNITPERLRFDFAYGEKLTDEQKKEVEDLVNAAIEKDYPVTFAMMNMDEARAKGAIGLFDDNYGDEVKVYSVGDPEAAAQADPNSPTFSREFCGGPHVERTGSLGIFKIKKEKSCSAGVRRIRAVLE